MRILLAFVPLLIFVVGAKVYVWSLKKREAAAARSAGRSAQR